MAILLADEDVAGDSAEQADDEQKKDKHRDAQLIEEPARGLEHPLHRSPPFRGDLTFIVYIHWNLLNSLQIRRDSNLEAVPPKSD